MNRQYFIDPYIRPNAKPEETSLFHKVSITQVPSVRVTDNNHIPSYVGFDFTCLIALFSLGEEPSEIRLTL